MFGLFAKKLPIDDEEFEWICACCKWFADEFEGMERLRKTHTVLAHASFFPRSSLTGERRAEEIFKQVAAHADMADWPCVLEPFEGERPTEIGPGLGLRHISEPSPAGTFSYQDGECWISYDVALLQRPHDLIATFAHELSHYLLHSAKSLPPGGEVLEEHATDLGAVFLGFGAFMANSARNFSQFQTAESQGWENRQQGYLSELALVSAYALMTLLTSADQEAATKELKPYLQKPFKAALAAIEKRFPNLPTEIEAIDLTEWQ